MVKLFVAPKEVHSYVGARIVARDVHGNRYKGRIVKVHSESKAVVRAFFEPNIPGQLIGGLVEVFRRR